MKMDITHCQMNNFNREMKTVRKKLNEDARSEKQ